MRAKSRLVALLLAALPLAALADCRAFEYAELEAMSPAEVLRLRCDYGTQMRQHVQAAGDASRSGGNSGAYAASAILRRAEACASEVNRLDRILKRKYQLQGDETQVTREIGGMCARPPP